MSNKTKSSGRIVRRFILKLTPDQIVQFKQEWDEHGSFRGVILAQPQMVTGTMKCAVLDSIAADGIASILETLKRSKEAS
jgi:hypothetical protein